MQNSEKIFFGDFVYSMVISATIANFFSWLLRFIDNSDYYLKIDLNLFFLSAQIEMIEVFLFGIVLGLIPITLAGLFVTAYLQYRRSDQLDL
ncbi:Cytochrome b6-F complex subunit 5 [Rhynchospora pubera]|uniref:Cytochrome b6-F complex subunit 5 n=5 Tax=Mesangiospermae TaxID=1437183 RepID=A0AAV8APS6_9POAL|nr:Cytochrome b6-F complex subunit 5 [Rhynchospora pubera]